MKKLILSTVLLFAILRPAHAGGESLVGTWKSNKEATLDYLKTHTKLTPQQLEKLGSILGKMEFTFDGQTLTAKSGDWKFVSKYKIIEQTKNALTFESEDPGTKKLTNTRIEMDGAAFGRPTTRSPAIRSASIKLSALLNQNLDKRQPGAEVRIIPSKGLE